MSTKYYSLLVRHEHPQPTPWGIEFGSYIKSEVREELQCYCSSYDHPCTLTKIIETSDTQHEINAEIIRLNEELGYIRAPR